jgi:hypothetical protein
MDDSAALNPYTPPQAALEGPAAEAAIVPALWNPDVAGLWSLFFTPVFGSFLVLKNWQAIGDRDRIWLGRMWLAASLVMMLPFLFVPRLQILYVIAWYFAWQRKQTRYITERWGKSYPHKRWGAPILWGIVWMIVVVVAATAVEIAAKR